MSKVAFMTIGLLKAPRGDEQVQGFFDRSPAIISGAEVSPGFIARSFYDERTWGTISNPTIFQDEEFEDMTPQTQSSWQDLESVFAFAYRGVHAEAMRKRNEWFVKPEWPTYVAWWIADGHTPSWEEAYQRYDQLHQQGASAEAFDFKHPFGADGQPVKIDRQRVKEIKAQYTYQQ